MLSTRRLARAVPTAPAAAVAASVRDGFDPNKIFAREMSGYGLPVTYESRGTGGRSSISGITSTVFGATGYLGRYVVNHLGKSGSRMILPTRCGDNAKQHLKVMGDLGQIVDLAGLKIRDDSAIKYAVERSNVVVNLLGREWETRNFSFDDVHRDFPERLARICKELGVERLVHVSALGATLDHPSKYYRTKAEGDEAVRAAFPNATIVKPAKLIGTEDRLLNVFAEHTCKFPVQTLIDDGGSKHQPVYVDDVALAIRAIVHDESTAGRTFELCGEKILTMEDMLKMTQSIIRAQNASRVVYVPSFILKMLAAPHEFLLNRVPFPLPTPTGLTRSYIDAQGEDYLKDPKSEGFKELGIVPAKLEGVVIDYLRAFRFGGYDVGATAGQGSE
uniref:NAD-dependent epimerase/dehydratase domain-containing protein n=1 Tax=Micromonas pusilla TaxID=38833 RepID=A0A7R9Y4M6_MICPS